MSYNNLCYWCFAEKPIREKPCPKCGYSHTPSKDSQRCLVPGTLLHDRYVVGIPLGVGGFGITYKCLDTKIGGVCTVKEYFPSNCATRQPFAKIIDVQAENLEKYNKIMKRFVKEANLVKTLNHRNIISIYDSFFDNNTAYYAMEYCDGIDLRRYTDNFKRRLEYDEGMNLLYQIMNALEYLHSKGIFHRDIAPDNIYVTKTNSIKLLDFGSARSEMEQKDRELSAIVKVGYAPIEQYGGRGKQGPYTDIYALGATFYHLFTQVTPMESTQRAVEDSMVPFSALRPDLPENFKFCIERCMEVTTHRRVSSIAEMKSILGLSNVPVKMAKKRLLPEKTAQNKKITPPVAGYGKDGFPKSSKNPSWNPSSGYQNHASLAYRLFAYTIDFVLWLAVYMLVVLNTVGFSEGIGINKETLGYFMVFLIVFVFINTILELLTTKSIGKALLGLCVKSKTGGPMSFGQVLMRNIIKFLGIFVAVFATDDELLEDKLTESNVCVKE